MCGHNSLGAGPRENSKTEEQEIRSAEVRFHSPHLSELQFLWPYDGGFLLLLSPGVFMSSASDWESHHCFSYSEAFDLKQSLVVDFFVRQPVVSPSWDFP